MEACKGISYWNTLTLNQMQCNPIQLAFLCQEIQLNLISHLAYVES